jgi:hypothetical protein
LDQEFPTRLLVNLNPWFDEQPRAILAVVLTPQFTPVPFLPEHSVKVAGVRQAAGREYLHVKHVVQE